MLSHSHAVGTFPKEWKRPTRVSAFVTSLARHLIFPLKFSRAPLNKCAPSQSARERNFSRDFSIRNSKKVYLTEKVVLEWNKLKK